MRTDKSYMIVISHFKLYIALFPLKWLICIPNISAVRGNVVFETLHDFYRTAILLNKDKALTGGSQCFDMAHATYCLCQRTTLPFSLIAYRSSFTIPIPTKTGNTKIRAMMEKSSPPHDPTAKENQKRSSCPSIRNSTDFILRKQ